MGPQEDYIETVLTCEGDYYDPEFPGQLEKFSESLRHLLLDEEQPLIIKKVEPWNSVKVTFNIPKEAAQRLKQLAEQGNHALRALGVLAVQIEGDRVISLTLAGKNDERTELVLRTTDGTPQGVAPSTSMFDMSSNDELNVPGQSNVEATSRNIAQYLKGDGSPGMFDSLFNLSQSGTGMDMFRSPNVVATMSEPIPFPPSLSQAGQLTQSRPLGISTSTASQFSYPPGRSPTGYPTSQGIPSPGYSRSPSASGSPKFPSPMQSPSPSSFQTPPTPPPPYPSMQSINNLPRMVLNKAGMMQSPLLVNLLQNEAAQQAAAGHYINNLPPNKMPPPPPEMSPPQKRKRKKHKDSRKQNFTVAQMTTQAPMTATNSDAKSDQQKKQRQQPKMAPEAKEKFIAHLDDIMQNIINPDSPSGADNDAESSLSPVHIADQSSNLTAVNSELQSSSCQLGGLNSPINSSSLSLHQSSSEPSDSVLNKNIMNPVFGVSGGGSPVSSSTIFPGSRLPPPHTISSIKGNIHSGMPSIRAHSSTMFANQGNNSSSVQAQTSDPISNPLCTGTGTTGVLPLFSNTQSKFGGRADEKIALGVQVSGPSGVICAGSSASSIASSSIESFSRPGSRDLHINTSPRVLPPPEPEPEHIPDPYEGIPPGTEVIINPYTGQLEPVDSINDGSIEGLENEKIHHNSKEKMMTENSDSVSPKHKNKSEAAKERSPFRASVQGVSRQVIGGRDTNSVVNDGSVQLGTPPESLSTDSNEGIVPKSKTAPLVSAISREIKISQTNSVTVHGNCSPTLGIATSTVLTSASSSQCLVSSASPDIATSSVQQVPHNSHSEPECSRDELGADPISVTGYKTGAASAYLKSSLPSIHHMEANTSSATGLNGPIPSPGVSHSVDHFSRRSPENRVHHSPRGAHGHSESSKSPVHIRSPVQINHAMESKKSGLSEAMFKDKFFSNLSSGILHLDGQKDVTQGCIGLPDPVGFTRHLDSKVMASADSNALDLTSEMPSQNSVSTLGLSQIDRIKYEISSSKDTDDLTDKTVTMKPTLHGGGGGGMNQCSPTPAVCDGPIFTKSPQDQRNYGLQKSPIQVTNHRQNHNEYSEVNSTDHGAGATQENVPTSNWMRTTKSKTVNAKSPSSARSNEPFHREGNFRPPDSLTVHHNAFGAEHFNAIPIMDGQNLGFRLNVRRTDSGYMSTEHISENSEQNVHCDTKMTDETLVHNATHDNDRNYAGHSEHSNSHQRELVRDGAKIVKENNVGTANCLEEHLNVEENDFKFRRLNVNPDELTSLEKIAYEKFQQARSKGISILKPLYDRDVELNDDMVMVSELKDLKDCAVDICAKIPGKKDSARVAVSLANSAVLASLQQKSKNVLGIDRLLEDGGAKQVSKVAAEMTGMIKQVAKTQLDLSQQTTARVPSSKKEETGNRSNSPRNCAHMPNLISKAGPDLSFFNSSPHPITAPIFPFNLTQSVKKVVGPIPSSDRPIKLKPLPSPSSPRSTSPRGHSYSRSMSQGIDTSPVSSRAHTSPILSSVSRMSPNTSANLPDSNVHVSPPKSTSVSPSSYYPPQRMDKSVDNSPLKTMEMSMRLQSAHANALPYSQGNVTKRNSSVSEAPSLMTTSLLSMASPSPRLTTEIGQSVGVMCKGNTGELPQVNTGVSLHNPTSVVPPVSPPVNSALPPNLTEVPLPLAIDSSNSGNPPSCDTLSSNNQSGSYKPITCVPNSDLQVLPVVPGIDVHSTPSKIIEPVVCLPVEMHKSIPQSPDLSETQPSFKTTLPIKDVWKRDGEFLEKSGIEDLSGQMYIQKHAGQVAGSNLHQWSQGNEDALDNTSDSGLILPKVEIKIEDTSLQDNDLKAHNVQSVFAMKLEPDELVLVQDEPMSARLRTNRGSTEHRNDDTGSEVGDHPDNNSVIKSLRGRRTNIERPDSPSLRVGRSQRIRRKTPTPFDELETKSDTTDRSESPKPSRPQRTKRRLLEDGEFHDLVVPVKRTRTLTDDSWGSSKTGNSLDSSEDELNAGELTSKIRAGLKHKLNDLENMDRVSPRNRRPTPKMEAMELKRSGRQSRSNSRGASDGTPLDDGQDNGVKGKPTRAGSREVRKPSDEADKNPAMNTRRNTERSKAKEKSPPRAMKEKSPPRVKSRRNSPAREKKELSPEPVNRRTTRSKKPKDNPDSLPPPANKRRRSSRDHR